MRYQSRLQSVLVDGPGLLRVFLRGYGREQVVALFARAAVFDQLQEGPTRAAPAIASPGQHATIAFNRQRVGQDGSAALLPELPQYPGEQGLLGLLEDFCEHCQP